MKINYVLLIQVLIPSLSNTMDKLVKLEKNKRSTSEPYIKKSADRPIKLSHTNIGENHNPIPHKKSCSLQKIKFTFETV